ncbi:MAG: ABC transporter permease [Theionarchaea archaeon]|nr:ABC transporter permease [Theionarchaea archaeon]MBU7036387.1 ABC transporter permease [Theionarchaea archaeon]
MGMRTIFSASRQAFYEFLARPVWIFEMTVSPFVFATVALIMFRDSPSTNSTYIVMAGGIMGMWGSTLLGAGYSVVIERYFGTLQYLFASPSSLEEIIAGKALTSAVMGLWNLVFVFLIAIILFGVDIEIAHPLTFLLALGLCLFSFSALGILLSTLFVLSRSAAALGNILEFAAFVVCGIMYPISFLPVWIRPLSYILTPTWGAQVLRWAVIEPQLGEGFWIGVAMIGILSCSYIVIGHYLYSRIDYQVRVTASLWRF